MRKSGEERCAKDICAEEQQWKEHGWTGLVGAYANLYRPTNGLSASEIKSTFDYANTTNEMEKRFCL